MQLLKGKKALVTGGTSGIGKTIATQFAKQGADVAIFGTNPENAERAINEIKQVIIDPNQKVLKEIVNVADLKEVENAISDILNEWGNIDVLINNAGITRDNLLIRMKEEEWDKVIHVNLKSIYNTCRSLARPMMKAKAGSIINITSVAGLTGNAGQVNYSASKSGMIGFTKSLAKELASRGIRVNCIAPGFIETRMTEVLPDAVKNDYLAKIPLKRFGDSLDIAKAAVFLASDMSNYITGQTLTVDGGLVM